MIAARPALTALGCRSCQNAIYKAVLSTSTLRTLPQPRIKTSSFIARRPFSADHQPPNESTTFTKPSDEHTAENLTENVEDIEKELEDEQPWFLEEAPPRHAPSLHKADLPVAPGDAPGVVEPMIKYIYEDMGLDEISLLDLRELDPPASLGPNLIMLFATARSERHLHISAGRFQRWLKKHHKVNAKADGLIGAGELKTKLRRLRKKAKLLGSNTAMTPGVDYGISTGWVCVNFSINESEVTEAAKLDDDGKFSGFGAARTGTTVVIQCMTEGRRKELDLEPLWKGLLKKSLNQSTRVKGEQALDPAKVEEILASKLQIHVPPPTEAQLQWEAFHHKLEKRQFSTSARSLQAVEAPIPTPLANELTLEGVRQKLVDIQFHGEPMDHHQLKQVLQGIMSAPSSSDPAREQESGLERISLLDQILKTAEERGIAFPGEKTFLDSNMLVRLITSILQSPAYGPKMKQTQENLEFLLTQTEQPPGEHDLVQLLAAYASRKDWTRFWDAFRFPARFNQSRDEKLYIPALKALAESNDAQLCYDMLPELFYEMTTEDPPVNPGGAVYEWLVRVISIADPMVEQLLEDSMRLEASDGDLIEDTLKARKRRVELLGILKDIRMIRQYHSAGVV